MTHLDLVYLMSKLSKHLSNSDKEHIILLKNIFHYMSNTLNLSLTFINNNSELNNLVKYINLNFIRVIDR